MKFYLLLILLFSCADIFIPDDNSYKSVYLDGNAWIEIQDQNDCENGLRVIDDSFLIEIYFSGGDNPTNDAGTLFSFVGRDGENFTDSNCNQSWNDAEEFSDTNENDVWDSYCLDSGSNDWNENYSTENDCQSNGHTWTEEEFIDCNESQNICEGDGEWNDSMGNGQCDQNEEFFDENGNGQWDIGGEFENNEFIVLAVTDDPSLSNILSFYINNEREEIEINGADFTDSNEFHLLQIFSDANGIYFYLDNIEVYSKQDNIMIQGASFMIGALANESLVENLWHGHIDEIRLWRSILTDDIRAMHYENSEKLITTMQDTEICNLIGLWTFNYNTPSSNIYDEKCNQINNLHENICDYESCDLLLLDGVLYTLSGEEVDYSENEF